MLRRLNTYKASRVANSPVIWSPSFVSISNVQVPAAPVVVQSSGLPSALPRNWLRLPDAAFAIHTRFSQTSMYLPNGGEPPSALAAAAAVTLTGFVPDVALLTPIAIPLNVTHCQKVLLGNVSAPLRVVKPVPSVSTIRSVVPSVSRTPTSPLSTVK